MPLRSCRIKSCAPCFGLSRTRRGGGGGARAKERPMTKDFGKKLYCFAKKGG